MVDPRAMCRRHLLGEHVELHMAVAWIRCGRAVDGWVDGNCLEPASIGARHTDLATEMAYRGWNHASPLVQPLIGARQQPEARIDKAAAERELARRRKDCAKGLAMARQK